jgi:hypothetical protein
MGVRSLLSVFMRFAQSHFFDFYGLKVGHAWLLIKQQRGFELLQARDFGWVGWGGIAIPYMESGELEVLMLASRIGLLALKQIEG